MKHSNKLFVLCLWLSSSIVVHGQSNSSQLWNEYMLNMPGGNRFNLEFAASYSTVLESPKWRTLDLQLTPEIALNKHIDIMGALLVSSTIQNESLSTTEIREMIGTRIHINPDSRLEARLLLRLEQRNMYDKGTYDWDHSTRSRIRVETVYPFNARSMGEKDRIWYGLADTEAFIVLDKDLKERFANRLRFRLGAGYRFSYRFRAEFIYMLQASKNTTAGGFDSRDNIFRFRLKHYLKKDRKKDPEGSGS